MRRAVVVVLLVGVLPLGRYAASDSAMSVIGDAAAFTPPSLTASIPYSNPRSTLGWGSFDLSARPEAHEFRVDLMVGTPVDQKRWSQCRELELHIDGHGVQLPARYSGVSMDTGVYDAVSVELTIEHVRSMSTAADVRAHLCGDAVDLPIAQLRELRLFVRRFEEMATHDGPSHPAPPRLFDPEDPDPRPEHPVLPYPA